MATKQPFGSWSSPITGLISGGSSPYRFSQLQYDGKNLYWVDDENDCQSVLTADSEGKIRRVTPSGYNVRTRAHEYGGRSYVVHEDVIYFANFADQRLYRQNLGEEPRAITAPGPLRYADMIFDAAHHRIIAVREDHRCSDIHAESTIVAIDPQKDEYGTVLISGHDFYMHPRQNRDGSQLAYLAWNHPQMPWDGTELWLGDIGSGGKIIHSRCLSDSATDSILEPTFSPQGILTFLSDRSGWWNLYRWIDQEAQRVYPTRREFGLPAWVFGMATYGYLSEEYILTIYMDDSVRHLALIDIKGHSLRTLDLPYTYFDSLIIRDRDYAAFAAASWHDPVAVIGLSLSSGNPEIIKTSSALTMDPRDVSVPQTKVFPTSMDQEAFMTFYAPKNHLFTGMDDELPPLIVISHGGPTSGTRPFSTGQPEDLLSPVLIMAAALITAEPTAIDCGGNGAS